MRTVLQAVASFVVALTSTNQIANAGYLSGRERVDPRIEPWNAVGMINTAAYGRCTGVLIGPQLAVTAAHCLYNRRMQRFSGPQSVYFVLGYDRGKFAFNTLVAEIKIGPGYDLSKPFQTIQSDWALLRLADPASVAIRPLDQSTVKIKPGALLTAAGFGRNRAYALSATAACRFISLDDREMLVAACGIVEGYSGGPLLDEFGRLIGINVAVGKAGGSDVLFAVPVSAWGDRTEQ